MAEVVRVVVRVLTMGNDSSRVATSTRTTENAENDGWKLVG